jgi:hypothetical protein
MYVDPGKMAIIERHIKIQHDAASGVTTVTVQSDHVEDYEARCKRVKREELELLKLEHEINTMIVENKMKEQTRIVSASMEIERIRNSARSNLDDRTRLII